MESLHETLSFSLLSGMLMCFLILLKDSRITRAVFVIGYVVVIVSLGLTIMMYSYPEPAVNTYLGGAW